MKLTKFKIPLRKRQGVRNPAGFRSAGRGRMALGRLYRFWATLSRPFQKSIHIRFRFAFALAIFGLALMAAITFVSSRVLLGTYEDSVAEARNELVPVSRIHMALREVDHLGFNHAVEGDRSAGSRFETLAETVDVLFGELFAFESRFGSLEHAHSAISRQETLEAWHAVRAAMADVFKQEADTAAAVQALERAHPAIDAVFDRVSEFHDLALEDFQKRLLRGHFVANAGSFVMLAAILAGLVLLIWTGIVVGRSVLEPIAELQHAARKLGEKDFSYRVKLRNSKDELGQLARAFNIASSSLQRLYGELEKRSLYDGLTGVLNRAAFNERLADECKSADRHKQPLTLLMVDIDFFKRVNDSYGHQTGDLVLRAIADVMSATCRPGDVVSRYGGEEFTVILPDTDAQNAFEVAERLRKAIAGKQISCSTGSSISVTASVGSASRRFRRETPEDLIGNADKALYRAKETGRDRVVSATNRAPINRAGRQDDAA